MAKTRSVRHRNEDGSSLTLIGLDERRFADLYHYLLNAPWPLLLLIVIGAFATVNAIFAGAYMLDGGIENARRGSFADAFFFSVQTMATIGYGKMAPATLFANALTTIEAVTGLVGLAVVTGLVFAKFSRPTARVRFSRIAVISRRDGVPSLMFRMANVRGNRIMEATIHVVLARQEKTLEGEDVRRFYDLELSRYRNATFAYSWTAIHPIVEGSPFHGETAESLAAQDAEVIVSLIGLDETFAQTVHARHSYGPEDLRWGARLADILHSSGSDTVIDFSSFDQTEPAE